MKLQNRKITEKDLRNASLEWMGDNLISDVAVFDIDVSRHERSNRRNLDDEISWRWREGQSASQIARELGGITRNSVIGRVHRLGLSERSGNYMAPVDATDTKPSAATPTKVTIECHSSNFGRPANEISPEALAKVHEIEKKAKKVGLMELTERTAKWPVGDPADGVVWLYGVPVKPDGGLAQKSSTYAAFTIGTSMRRQK